MMYNCMFTLPGHWTLEKANGMKSISPEVFFFVLFYFVKVNLFKTCSSVCQDMCVDLLHLRLLFDGEQVSLYVQVGTGSHCLPIHF